MFSLLLKITNNQQFGRTIYGARVYARTIHPQPPNECARTAAPGGGCHRPCEPHQFTRQLNAPPPLSSDKRGRVRCFQLSRALIPLWDVRIYFKNMSLTMLPKEKAALVRAPSRARARAAFSNTTNRIGVNRCMHGMHLCWSPFSSSLLLYTLYV